MSSPPKHRTFRLSLLALAALGVTVSVYFAMTRQPKTDRLSEPPPVATLETEGGGANEPAAAPAALTATATAKIDELNASSETFRNTTFVIAIRGAGFFCDDVVHVYQGDIGVGKWLVTCRDMRAYTIGVSDDGGLGVQPVMNYFDAPVLTIPRDPQELR